MRTERQALRIGPGDDNRARWSRPGSVLVEEGLERLAAVRAGRFDLSWMQAAPPRWGTRPPRSAIGLTLDDINSGPYGIVPERAQRGVTLRGAAGRTSEKAAAPTYEIDDKAEVWADNAAELYEEAALRQWSSTRDIPWERLEPLPDDLERAVCQLCTQLTQMEFVAVEMPARWIGRVSRDFHEVTLFLATQVHDEARHLEVFRKRALANGGGLLRPSARWESIGRMIMEAPTFTVASALTHILFEGWVLSLFRDVECFAPTEVEKRIFQLCVQDEARHIAYGIRHLQYFLARHPERAAEIHAVLAAGEEALFALAMEPQSIEPQLILAGGSIERMGEGLPRLAAIHQRQVREYLHRLEMAGIDRSTRCRIPRQLPS